MIHINPTKPQPTSYCLFNDAARSLAYIEQNDIVRHTIWE